MLLRLRSRWKKLMTEVQRQSGPCPRDCEYQIRMKKAGRISRVSEGEKICLLFWDIALPDKEDSPGTFSQCFFDSESEESEATWSSSSSDSKGSPFLWTPTTSGSDGVMWIPLFACMKSSVSALCAVQIWRTGSICRFKRATSIWSSPDLSSPGLCSVCVHWLNPCFKVSWHYAPMTSSWVFIFSQWGKTSMH